MKKKVVILGAGVVGRAVAYDLSRDYDVTAVDKDELALRRLLNLNCRPNCIKTVLADLSQTKEVACVVSGADVVVSAVPGFLGYNTLVAAIDAGKNVVDVSFFNQDGADFKGNLLLNLTHFAQDKKVTAVIDCGIAPGLSNMILGCYDNPMKIKKFTCFVGGLPKVRTWPFEYKAPFSPADVIEEYLRPARYVANGKICTKPALSEVELVDFPGIGTLEAFLTDGLRTLTSTMPHIPNMEEKTLRYPGHTALISTLKKIGFFDKEPIEIGYQKVSPLELTSKLLISNWQLREREEEFTIMRIIIENEEKRITFNLYDEFDPKSNLSSMARTTGFTAAAVATMILENQFKEKGIFPLERIGQNADRYCSVIAYLKKRGISFIIQQENL